MGTVRAVAIALSLTVAMVVVPAAPSLADSLDDAATALRRDPVYNHPEAERRLSDAEVASIRQRISDGSTPIFVAVLPSRAIEEAGGNANGVAARVGSLTGLRGTYAVLAGDSFRAASNVLPGGRAGELATDAFTDRRVDGPAAVLSAFVERVQTTTTGVSGGQGSDPFGSSGDGNGNGNGSPSGGSGLLVPLLLLGGIAAFFMVRSSNKRRAQERQLVLGGREDLRAELNVLANDVMRLEPDVAIHPEARSDYEAAVARFQWLQVAIDSIDSEDDIPRLRRAMTEARYAMARAQAAVRGQTPPAPPIDLRDSGPSGEPAVRVGRRGEPEYDGYGPGAWGGGGFFGGNGMLSGLLIGSMLGGSLGGWGASADSGASEQGHDDGWDGGGGDFGGGDFGGGDFGGGDFGGGDF